jgi:glycosyltransferase involved in cell wall biosynthesis
MKGSIGIAAVGDVTDINTWSNIPYYFFKAGESGNYFTEPWKLDLSAFRTSRTAWNMLNAVTGRGIGGYQYSKDFLDKAEQQIPPEYFSSTVISFNQVFPRASSVRQSGGRMFYYIDTTLHDLFNTDQYGINIPERMKQFALKQEQHNYEQADGVVTMGRWSHESLINHYSIQPNKIHHILPGANLALPGDFSAMGFASGAGTSRELRLGFVGKDWKRKGLPLLLDVRDCIVATGLKATVVALGNAPAELNRREGIEFSGFIDKRTDIDRFVATISSCDIGCLFSSAEALGISTLEFLRVGVPVAGFYHQGLKDTLVDSASLRFELNDSAKTIADRIVSIVRDERTLRSLKENAMLNSSRVTWDACVEKWKKVIG